MDRVRVFVAADAPDERARLIALLEPDDRLEVVGQGPADLDVDAVRDADSEVVVVSPGVPLDDSDAGPWPDLEGRALIVLTSSPHGAAAAMAAGARGALTPDTEAPVLGAAIRAVARGLLVTAPELGLAAGGTRGQDAGVLIEDLTPRELEVLQVLAEGRSNKEIAQRLGVSEHTVKFHVDAILGKLGAHTRTEAVARAARHGLIIL
jgi:DNA-binding NarL/FixJ family response regulator